ncbi:hypothetical protein [Silvibacterium acidisoli]|uniref:hypothetical protein n=1 Tax=Acidobacteriaceae bacterium ZG23-2 TaxID=2883246 RepID=UPI00406CD012
MSASYEYQDYHLTPRGWENGSHREDGTGKTNVEPPPDRVMTTRWEETWNIGAKDIKKRLDVTWKSDNKEAIESLIAQFGDSPRQL